MNTTHFGFKTVAVEQKEALVADVFHSVAEKYDVMNDLMSLGIHRLWKRFTLDCAAARPGQTILDLAGGTGDLSAHFVHALKGQGQVILADINDSMLKTGRKKLRDAGIIQGIDYVQANAEALPFPSESFDLITMAFGLRNVTHKDKALASMYRILKPGGRLLVLEFSTPTNPYVKLGYDRYSFTLLPALGDWIADDADSYRYLAESIRMHPDQEGLKALMTSAGFEDVVYHNLTQGIVALHIGHKY